MGPALKSVDSKLFAGMPKSVQDLHTQAREGLRVKSREAFKQQMAPPPKSWAGRRDLSVNETHVFKGTGERGK